MNDMVKIALIAVASAIVVLVGASFLVGNNQPETDLLGGGTRFPNGISADSTSPSAGEIRGTTLTTTGASTLAGDITFSGALNTGTATTSTTTISVGKVCYSFTGVGGTELYGWYTNDGVFATSTASCS